MRHNAMIGLGLSECINAPTTAAASTGSGICSINDLPKAANNKTHKAATTPAHLLCAPDDSLAELAEKPAPTGIPRIKPETKFAAPSANNSRCGSTASPCCNAKLRMLPHDSAKIMTNKPPANSAALNHCCLLKSGMPTRGTSRSN